MEISLSHLLSPSTSWHPHRLLTEWQYVMERALVHTQGSGFTPGRQSSYLRDDSPSRSRIAETGGDEITASASDFLSRRPETNLSLLSQTVVQHFAYVAQLQNEKSFAATDTTCKDFDKDKVFFETETNGQNVRCPTSTRPG